jgi:hypothetical protein
MLSIANLNLMVISTQAYDPLGALVNFRTRFYDSEGIEKDYAQIKEDIARIIQKPGIMIQVFDNPIKIYYFGVINWDHTLLIGVHRIFGIWNVDEIIENPSTHFVLKLLKRGGQLI